ncbi:Adenylate kinase 4 [Nibea albiflora]|uniref:Adenylate kinase 4 n=1 Tax=Nibea albiflora TaxID=240163 RepID=A0ACB7ELW2_NIBAL|nr:Adenylate kinase 4 [Nibea albiflora]
MAKLFRAAIMGPPGSGKGTISKRIAQSFGLQYLSSGHFLRESVATNTGFPRTLAQAEALNSLHQLDLVISLNIPYETLRERLSDRWIHPASGRVYNMGFNPPRVQGKDDVTGEPLIQHDDDKPEALMARLRHYKDVAKPVIDLYKSVNTPPVNQSLLELLLHCHGLQSHLFTFDRSAVCACMDRDAD